MGAGFCQSGSATVPETAFISADRYTNAFFGFSLPLPQERDFHAARVKSSDNERYVFALGRAEGNTTIVISAKPMNGADAETLMRAAPQIWLHGMEFGKGTSQQKTPAGKVWKATYLTVIDSYLLEFNIQSNDQSVVKELERCVEEIRFFDPSKARAVAGPNSVEYKSPPPDRAQHR
jgi:hypothetical protein